MSVDDLFTLPPEAFGLCTPRLVLRLPQRRDRAARLRARAEDYDHLRPLEPLWAPDHLTYTGGEAWEKFAREQYVQKRSLSLFIYERGSDEVIGSCEAVRLSDPPLASGMVGYWIREARRGRGYMPEALQMLCSHLHTVGGLKRIEAGCLPGNTASHRVLEKSGFRREGRARSFAEINGRYEDHVMFARLNSDLFSDARPEGG